MSTWVALNYQPHDFTVMVPTLELARRAGIATAPGVRLSKDHLAVEDGDGFFTRFCKDKAGTVFARVIDPTGNAVWFRECPEIHKPGRDLGGQRSVGQ